MKYYKLHLIRHGLTQGNMEGLYIGSGTDLPLCPEGRHDLHSLQNQFRYPAVPLVFSSPLRRATETAQLLYPDAKLVVLDDLREMAFGKFENQPLKTLVQNPEFAAWMDPTSHAVPEGAEDRVAFYRRTGELLMKLFEYQFKTHTEEAACITHGGVIMSMLAQHALPQRRPEDWMTDPGCGYSVRCDAEMYMRDHLAEAFDVVPYGYLDAAKPV
ncbi:MAG: histidine phosphatase family protein [Gemmiger sp.]|nr:histidine phosphatase family protein [Gemmiger sp.]